MTGKQLGRQPAFPQERLSSGEMLSEVGFLLAPAAGITKREYFSSSALEGLLACTREYEDINKAEDKAKARALLALRHADALLDELAKEQA